MSAHSKASHPAQGHHDHDDHAHGTVRGYLIGFVLSVALTAIPFWMAVSDVPLSPQAIGVAVMALAVVQVVVHMIYFLHMNPRSEGGWNMLALLFTIIIAVIMLAGSLWVMFHLNTNMMPVTGDEVGIRR